MRIRRQLCSSKYITEKNDYRQLQCASSSVQLPHQKEIQYENSHPRSHTEMNANAQELEERPKSPTMRFQGVEKNIQDCRKPEGSLRLEDQDEHMRVFRRSFGVEGVQTLHVLHDSSLDQSIRSIESPIGITISDCTETIENKTNSMEHGSATNQAKDTSCRKRSRAQLTTVERNIARTTNSSFRRKFRQRKTDAEQSIDTIRRQNAGSYLELTANAQEPEERTKSPIVRFQGMEEYIQDGTKHDGSLCHEDQHEEHITGQRSFGLDGVQTLNLLRDSTLYQSIRTIVSRRGITVSDGTQSIENRTNSVAHQFADSEHKRLAKRAKTTARRRKACAQMTEEERNIARATNTARRRILRQRKKDAEQSIDTIRRRNARAGEKWEQSQTLNLLQSMELEMHTGVQTLNVLQDSTQDQSIMTTENRSVIPIADRIQSIENRINSLAHGLATSEHGKLLANHAKDTARRKRAKKQMTIEERNIARAINTARRRILRQRMTDAERDAQRAIDAIRRRNARARKKREQSTLIEATLFPAQCTDLDGKDEGHIQDSSSDESVGMIESQRGITIADGTQSIENRTNSMAHGSATSERDKRLAKQATDTARQRRAKRQMTIEERNIARAINTARRRISRQRMTDAERDAQRAIDAIRRRNARACKKREQSQTLNLPQQFVEFEMHTGTQSLNGLEDSCSDQSVGTIESQGGITIADGTQSIENRTNSMAHVFATIERDKRLAKQAKDTARRRRARVQMTTEQRNIARAINTSKRRILRQRKKDAEQSLDTVQPRNARSRKKLEQSETFNVLEESVDFEMHTGMQTLTALQNSTQDQSVGVGKTCVCQEGLNAMIENRKGIAIADSTQSIEKETNSKEPGFATSEHDKRRANQEKDTARRRRARAQMTAEEKNIARAINTAQRRILRQKKKDAQRDAEQSRDTVRRRNARGARQKSEQSQTLNLPQQSVEFEMHTGMQTLNGLQDSTPDQSIGTIESRTGISIADGVQSIENETNSMGHGFAERLAKLLTGEDPVHK